MLINTLQYDVFSGRGKTIFRMTTWKEQGASQSNYIIPRLIREKKLWKGSLLACIIKDEVKAVGYPREGRIQCLCHKEMFSVSSFESHAGCKFKKGSGSIFLLDGSGKSLGILRDELEASRHNSGGQSSTTTSTLGSAHDDEGNTCNFCSREGELTFCRTPSCPAAFHTECLPLPILPEWYCQKCSCHLCKGPLRTSDVALSHLVLCEQCGDEYHTGCLLDRENFCYNLDFKWFCSKDCKKAFEILREIIHLTLPPSDPHPITLVRFSGDQDDILFFDDDAPNLYTLETRKAAEATRLFATLKLLEKSSMEKNRQRIPSELFHNMLYPDPNGTSRSTERVMDHIGFYTFLLEQGAGDRVISRVIAVATIRVHGKKVAEMPFIATSESDRGKGFCTNLMEGLQKILSRLEVQYLVVHSPPEFVAMWTSKHSFQRVNDETKRSLLKRNLMKLNGSTLLCKTLDHA